MDFAILLAKKLREKYPRQSNIAFINYILEKYRLRIDLWPIGTQKFSGCLWENNGQWTIVINSRQAPQRRLFTLAHELGHYFLHRRVQRHFSCGLPSPGPAHRLEREANSFAAELLMPAPQVLYTVEKTGSAARTARQFGVSEEAMQYRLQGLASGTRKVIQPLSPVPAAAADAPTESTHLRGSKPHRGRDCE